MDRQALLREVTFQAVLSRGPGGQNVNRTASAALLSWDFEHSKLINQEQRHLIRTKLANIINKNGLLYLRSDEFRELERNKDRSLDKLLDWLEIAFHIPKKRKKTRPTRASKERRHESKSRRKEVKRNRQRIDDY